MDQNRIGGVINQLNKSGFGKNIYCVLCSRTTTDQKIKKVDKQLFIDIMTWFVQESGHPGFKDIPIPEKGLQPLVIEDEETKNQHRILFK
jgi:hypothetical protein